ncbi:MAG: HAD-IIA family hydrolase [Muribaculaceae bacterium]
MQKFNKYISPLSDDKLIEACSKIKHVALDMDGTIYLGSSLFPYTIDFLLMLNDNGIKYSFLTNNPTKSSKDYIEKLAKLGIEVKKEQIYTTAIATIDYIKVHYPEAKNLFLMGTKSMVAEFEQFGFRSTEDDHKDIPDIIVVAFDMTLTYERLCRAAWWISQGIPYIATNPDKVCPTDLHTILVDCGSLCKCLEYATGRRPDVTIGKPNPDMLQGIKNRYNIDSCEIAMCGDRIYTDVAMAQNAGALGVLVLSGETTLETSLSSNPMPDITALNIAEFGKLLLKSRE